MKSSGPNITYGAELARKSIHLCSLSIPIVAWHLPRADAVLILSALFLCCLVLDYERGRGGPLGRLYAGLLGFLIRPHENDRPGVVRLTGATWMMLAAVVTFLVFPKPAACAAFAMLIVGDTVAALVGRRIGSIRFGASNKSLEGSLAFLSVSLVVALLTPDLPPLAGFLGAVAATLAEAFIGFLDDNLSIPLVGGGVMALFLL